MHKGTTNFMCTHKIFTIESLWLKHHYFLE